MKRMSGEEIAIAFEALKGVPRLPSYAQRCVEQLEQEIWAARAAENKLGEFRDGVAELVRSTDPLRMTNIPYTPGDIDTPKAG